MPNDSAELVVQYENATMTTEQAKEDGSQQLELINQYRSITEDLDWRISVLDWKLKDGESALERSDVEGLEEFEEVLRNLTELESEEFPVLERQLESVEELQQKLPGEIL